MDYAANADLGQLNEISKTQLILLTLLPSAYPVDMTETAILERAAIVRRGQRLEYFTIVWNLLEGLVAVVAGAMAGSISLVGFGIDSFVEVTSGTAMLWRIAVDSDVHRRELNEKRALRAVGICFLALSAYITYESIVDLWLKRAPEHSVPGIILACVSLVVMPVLSRAKRKVGGALGSAAMQADAKQTEFCAYLSAILLGGLLLNAFLGLWWADPLAALLMAPIIAKEGFDGLSGNACRDCVAS
jgi:divalent metal cation (Fe/Co/Zn/Cd) transporter